MAMNSNSLLNRVEISFYSALTSLLTAANRIQSKEGLRADSSFITSSAMDELSFIDNQDPSDDPLLLIWNRLIQAVLPIIIWMVLGFAAGFLIGMFRPR